MDLNRVDSFNLTDFGVAYSPMTNTTQQIMNKVASASFVNGEFSSNLRGISDVNICFV